jgi:serine protease Do
MNRTSSSIALALCLLAPAARAQDDPALARARAVERDLVDLIARVSGSFVAINSATSGGSGVIISADGEILTNHHVAGSRPIGKTWMITLPGGRVQRARVVGLDPRGDIALLKLEGPGPYPFVELGDSDAVQAGDEVIALGNPFGFSKDGTPHVTVGVVSAVHRFQGGYSDAIQTDTEINPGNSGGPLLDMQGRLIGINGRIAVRFGTRANTGVGYAIPTNQIRAFLPRFRAEGLVPHGQVPGLSLRESTAGGDGAIVERVAQGSEAWTKGLRAGDVVVEAGGRAVHNPLRFNGIIGTYPAGDRVTIVARRGQETVRVDLALVARASEEGGGGVAGKGAFLGVRMSTSATGGVEVEEVVGGSPAATAGITTGDVIKAIAVGGPAQQVADVAALVAVLSRLEPGTAIKLTIARGEEQREVDVTLGRRP